MVFINHLQTYMCYKLHNLFNPKVKDTAQMCSRKLRERRREKEKETKRKRGPLCPAVTKRLVEKNIYYNSKLI